MHHSIRTASAATAFAFVALTLAGSLGAQQLPPGCDAKLAPKDGRPATKNAYAPRGTATKWCEGVFSQEVGNTQLLLDAFTQRYAPMNAAVVQTLDSLTVEWNAPAGSVVHIVARQSRSPTMPFYQLDAEATTGRDGRGSWKWPMEVLRSVGMWPVYTAGAGGSGMKAPLVSVQASTRLAPDTANVYVPVRIVSRAAPAATNGWFQISMSAREGVNNLEQTVDRLNADGTKTEIKMRPECQGPRGGTVGGQLVTAWVCMPASATAGTYLLTVNAKSGGTAIRGKSIRFYYAPADTAK